MALTLTPDPTGGGGDRPCLTMAVPHRCRRIPPWSAPLLLACLLSFGGSVPAQMAGKAEPGLALTFHTLTGASPSADTVVAPNVVLFVEFGGSPTPFLPEGNFGAVWEGTITADLRGTFFFQAELNGSLKLEINGVVALELDGAGGSSPLSKAVPLKKGPNALKAAYRSPVVGDAFVRLFWTEKGTVTSPIPNSILNHAATPAAQTAAQLRLGRELFLEHRCAQCHRPAATSALLPELEMDAPSFDGIGARRNVDWMARWILDPKSQQAGAHMPRLLTGPNAREEAESIAGFLATLKTGGEVTFAEIVARVSAPPAGAAESRGEHSSLFETLHCAACHDALEANEADPQKVSLKQVARKFAPGKLAEYLRKPEARYRWIRMPNFKLSAAEARELSDALLAAADQPKEPSVRRDQAALAKGERLVRSVGCLNCHGASTTNRFAALKLADIGPSGLEAGCLAGEPKAGSKAPAFGFSAPEREALRAFLRTDRAALMRHVPAEFAARQTAALRCASCHGQFDGFPPLEILGEKLKPEWAAAFLAGESPYKPRAAKHPKGEPWLEARMPAFQSRAAFLARGLAAQSGQPPRSSPESAVDRELARLGQKLVGKDGGFSCVSCHGVGSMEAVEVFESEGINLAHASERLLPSYYRRWMRNPFGIDPQTKMPAYFDEGKSPLSEDLSGDAEQQITAIWHYLRLGRQMPAPGTDASQ